MSYICSNCGLIVESSQDLQGLCPSCSNPLQGLPLGAKRLTPSILDSIQFTKKSQGNIDNYMRGALKSLNTGSDHIQRGHYDSAANSFRKSMEFILNCWMYLVEENGSNNILRGWVCYKQDLQCKELEKVKIRPADKIGFLKDTNLLSEDTYEQFEYLRSIGNRGSHAGGSVCKQEAKRGSALTRKLIEDFKDAYSNISLNPNSAYWKTIKHAEAIALNTYSIRVIKDISFLQKKNIETLSYIERKNLYLRNKTSALPSGLKRELKAEIEDARAQYYQRKKEIDSLEILDLQIKQECERLLSVYDPIKYDELLKQRADYKKRVLKKKKYLDLMKKIALTIVCVAVAAICIFCTMYVISLH